MTEENLSGKAIPRKMKKDFVKEETVPLRSPHEISYICPSCNKKFKRKTACSSHMRICNVKTTSDSELESDYDSSNSVGQDFFDEFKKNPRKRTKINEEPQIEINETQVVAQEKVQVKISECSEYEPKSGTIKNIIEDKVKESDQIPKGEVAEALGNDKISVTENTAIEYKSVNIMDEFVSDKTLERIDNNIEEQDDYVIEELKNVQNVPIESDLENSNRVAIEEDSFEHVIEPAELEVHTLRFDLPEAVVEKSEQIKSHSKHKTESSQTPDVSIYEFVDEEDGFRQEQRKMDLERKKRTCKICYLVFEDPMEVLRHTRTAHSYPKVWLPTVEVMKHMNVKDKSKCPICGKPLYAKYRSEFIKHLKTHTEDYEYQCKVCKLVFRRKDHLRNHESRHIVGI